MTLQSTPQAAPHAAPLKDALTGISGILVTPFDAEDRIAPAKLAPIIDRALGAGMHIPVVNGNTGEFYSLTVDEAEAMCAEVTQLVNETPTMIAA